jgi:hypothetical protein
MSARVLLNGVLQKLPVRKISKAGKPYLMVSTRDGNGPDAKWWTVFAFAEAAIEALEVLVEGEAFAATGTFEATIWAPEGREPRVNLTMNADTILSAHKPPKAKPESKGRKPKEAKGLDRDKSSNTGGSAIAASSWAHPTTGGSLNDDIPF